MAENIPNSDKNGHATITWSENEMQREQQYLFDVFQLQSISLKHRENLFIIWDLKWK